jgi:TetR/AcrR family transcriptional repressor of mexJK operon
MGHPARRSILYADSCVYLIITLEGLTFRAHFFQLLRVKSMDSKQHPRHGRGSSPPTETKGRRGPGRQTASTTRQRNLELLDKALDLFFEKGFEGTSIDGIAAYVGMAKRTVYLRYGSKMGLFKASLQRAVEAWIVPVDRLRAAETDDAEETLLGIGHILVENIMNPAGLRLMRITNAVSGRMPEIGAFTYKQGTGPTSAYLTDLIRRRIRPHGVEVPEPQEAAMAFLYLVVGGPASMTAWGVVLSEAAIHRHTRYAVRLFLHGLLHPEHDVAGASAATTRRRDARKQIVTAPPIDLPARQPHHWKVLEEENRRLKVLLADSMLALAAHKDGSHSR